MTKPHFIPFEFDLSSLVQRSVASFYSHLVTRPTGQALRLGIESQIGQLGSVGVSVLDFTQVVVLDYSCADEAVAKLIQRYSAEDRPADVYFVARGLGEQHREPIDEVLLRHELTLVAEVEGRYTLLGVVDAAEHGAWHALQHAGRGNPDEVAAGAGLPPDEARSALERLSGRRVVLALEGEIYFALTPLVDGIQE